MNTEQEQINSDELLEMRAHYSDLLKRYGQLEDTHADCTFDASTIESLEIENGSLKEDVSDLESSLDFIESVHGLAESITFENSHEIAYNLYHRDPEAAKALLAELKYWIPNA